MPISFSRVALRAFLFIVLLFSVASSIAKAGTMADLIRQLGSPDQQVRTEAAGRLRDLYSPPERDRWDSLLSATHPGELKQDILKRFGVGKDQVEIGIGTGPVHMESYRLDDRWLLVGWFQNSDDKLKSAELTERVRYVWVKPADDFSGVWVCYFVNGQKSHEIQYQAGKYQGEFISYHANGSRSVVQHYNSQEADGQ
ncbi:MAG: hypothetical protein KDA78_20820, partial [Planctomycetaceae bacterium]|nr:hypothetical protein [Planctomycetaceae bacterium]